MSIVLEMSQYEAEVILRGLAKLPYEVSAVMIEAIVEKVKKEQQAQKVEVKQPEAEPAS